MAQAFLSSFVMNGGQQILDNMLVDDPAGFFDLQHKFLPKEAASDARPHSVEDFLSGLKDVGVIDGDSEEVP